jgi:hypothetical protein
MVGQAYVKLFRRVVNPEEVIAEGIENDNLPRSGLAIRESSFGK